MITDQSVPDEGPRSHAVMGKDSFKSGRCLDPAYPEIFHAVMALAHRDVCAEVHKFFENLKSNNYLKFTLLTQAYPGALDGAGTFERRAKFWSDKFAAWD